MPLLSSLLSKGGEESKDIDITYIAKVIDTILKRKEVSTEGKAVGIIKRHYF